MKIDNIYLIIFLEKNIKTPIPNTNNVFNIFLVKNILIKLKTTIKAITALKSISSGTLKCGISVGLYLLRISEIPLKNNIKGSLIPR